MIGLLMSLTVTLLALQVPQSSSGTEAWNLGVRMVADVPGRIIALRYFRILGDAGPHIGQVWSIAGVKLAEVDFSNETPLGWQRQDLLDPVFLAAGTPVVCSVTSPNGARYALQPGAFPLINGHLTGAIGVYGTIRQFPSMGTTPTNYFRDCEFIPQTITLKADPTGGFVAMLDGFEEGPYTLGVTLKDRKGIISSESLEIMMPPVKP